MSEEAIPAPNARWRVAAAYLVGSLPVLAIALGIYWRTLLPDVGLWDTAEMQTVGAVLGIAHPTGYPTYTLLAWLASVLLQPFGNEAYRADLLSALAMAGAASLLALRTVMATRRVAAGLVAGLAFALTPVAWHWGVRADPHALHVFLAAVLLVLMGLWQAREVRVEGSGSRWLMAAALVYGLSLGNHALTLLLAPGIAAFVLLVSPRILWRQWRLVLASAAVLALAAALVYLYLPLRAAMGPPLEYAHPATWEGFWYVVMGQQFQGSFGPLPDIAGITTAVWGELVHDLGPLALLAVAGLVAGLVRHPRLTVLGLLWFGCTWLFALGYPNAQIDRYYLVPLLVAGLWIGLAVDLASDALAWLLLGRIRLAPTSLVAAVGAGVLVMVLGPALGRFEAMDASGEDAGRQYLEATLGAVDRDALIISWWSLSTPLWYGQYVEGQRPDVTVLDDRDILDQGYGSASTAIEAYLGRRPVYVIRLEDDRRRLAETYRLTPVPGAPADLYRVEEPSAEGER